MAVRRVPLPEPVLGVGSARATDLAELVRDLLRPDDEVLAIWPPSEELRRDGVQLLMADEDEVPEGSPLGQLIRRWSAELPTILLHSRPAFPRREGPCLALPKPIPLPLFLVFVELSTIIKKRGISDRVGKEPPRPVAAVVTVP